MELFTKSGKQGFTLIELIIVIGIIAALVGIAMPYYGDYVNQSKHAVMRANLNTFEKALMDYRCDKGFYPGSANDLVSGVPKYLFDFPIDPTDGAPATWGYSLPYPLPKDVPAGEKYRYLLDSRYNAYRKPD